MCDIDVEGMAFRFHVPSSLKYLHLLYNRKEREQERDLITKSKIKNSTL